MIAYIVSFTLSTDISYLISSTSIIEIVDRFTQQFNDMRDWCIINLDVGTWAMSELKTEKKVDTDTIEFTHLYTFYNEEDALAFKLVYMI